MVNPKVHARERAHIEQHVLIDYLQAMLVVELVWWSGTDDFLNDVDAHFKPTIEHVSNADGCLAIYSGLEEEDKTTYWMVVVWESHEHHQAMMNRPDYPAMVGRLKPFFRDGLKMLHVEFNKDADAAFRAPTTAILFLTLKDGRKKEDAENALTVLTKVFDAGRGTYPPGVWGQTHGDAMKYILAIGWERVQVHPDVVRDNLYHDSTQEIYKIADVQMMHVNLRKHN